MRGTWILMTVLALVVFFFLFRVVYPQPQRFVPLAQQIVVLNPADPASRASINHVQDRDFMVLPSANQQSNAPKLEDRAPVFHPLYEKHELKLQDVPQRDSAVAPMRLLDVTEPILPHLDLSELHRAPPPPKSSPATIPKLEIRLTGALASRKLVSRPDFPAAVVSALEECQFEIGVNSEGRVTFALPTAGPDRHDESGKVLGLLQQLRFEPDASQSAGIPAWGLATLEWVAPPTTP